MYPAIHSKSVVRRLAAIMLVLFLAGRAGAEQQTPAPKPSPPSASNLHTHRTTSGVRFLVVGNKPKIPAPTLIHLATDAAGTLADSKNLARLGSLMAKDGYLSVSLDLPNHGDEEYASGNTGSIGGWRRRIEAGDNFLPAFAEKVSAVIDTLIREGYSDPSRITLSGTSRGGFIALHCAALEPRVRHVIGFSPVTDLRALREFEGMDDHPLTMSLSTEHLAERLADRDVWICIGSQDDRVSTDASIATACAYSRAALDRGQIGQVWLHVMPSQGHYTPKPAHDMAAAWLLERNRLDP